MDKATKAALKGAGLETEAQAYERIVESLRLRVTGDGGNPPTIYMDVTPVPTVGDLGTMMEVTRRGYFTARFFALTLLKEKHGVCDVGCNSPLVDVTAHVMAVAGHADVARVMGFDVGGAAMVMQVDIDAGADVNANRQAKALAKLIDTVAVALGLPADGPGGARMMVLPLPFLHPDKGVAVGPNGDADVKPGLAKGKDADTTRH